MAADIASETHIGSHSGRFDSIFKKGKSYEKKKNIKKQAIFENRTNAVCDTCKSLIEQIAMEKFIQEVFYGE